MLSRRGLFKVLSGAIAAPMVLRSDALMALDGIIVPPDIVIPRWCPERWIPVGDAKLNKWQFPELHSHLAKMRLYDAHKSSVFTIRDDTSFAWYRGYEAVGRSEVRMINHMSIMNYVPLFRASGSLVQPGSITTIEVGDYDLASA